MAIEKMLIIGLAWLITLTVFFSITPASNAADRTVGIGCTYPTITAALAAAEPDDRLLIEGGRTFLENLSITKNLILEGGYPGCASGSTGRTTIDGKAADHVIYVHLSALNVSMSKLNLTNGNSLMEGGGIDFYPSGGGGTLTLTDVDIYGNTALRGGGIWIGTGANANLTNVKINNNTSSAQGGGLRVFNSGTITISGDSTFNYNHSGGGGGAISTSADAGNTPVLSISNTTMQYNTSNGNGGAIELTGGALNFSGWWDLQFNSSSGNGGAVAVSGTGIASFNAGGGRASYLGNNYATGNGGGVYANNSSTVRLRATSSVSLYLISNGTGGNGGCGYADNGGYFDLYGLLEAASNIAALNGGAFYLNGGSRIWLDDYFNDRPLLRSNQAQNGGAIYALASPKVEFDGVEIESNAATSGSGGAVYLDGSVFSASNSTFSANEATLNGGSIAAFNSSTVEVVAQYPATMRTPPRETGELYQDYLQATACNPLLASCSSFYSNKADSDANGTGYGGAIYNNNSSLQVSDTSFHLNSAARGGAIYQEGASASALVSNTLAYANTVSTAYGAGIRSSGGNFTLTHVTLAGNTGGAGYSQSSTTSRVYNSIAWGNSNGGFLSTYAEISCNIDQSSNAGTALNPKFRHPADPGGTGDYRLQPGSPAIDACDTHGLARDLDNRPRPIGAKYDMGAYEALRWIFLPLILTGS